MEKTEVLYLMYIGIDDGTETVKKLRDRDSAYLLFTFCVIAKGTQLLLQRRSTHQTQ